MYLLMPMEDGLDCDIVIHFYFMYAWLVAFEVSFLYPKEANNGSVLKQSSLA